MNPETKDWLTSTGKNTGIMFAVMAVASIVGLFFLRFV